MEDTATTTTTNHKDDWCHDMGFLEAPLVHLATSSSKSDTSALTSKEKVTSIRASPYSPHVAILQANAKVLHVYVIRSVQDAARKRQRRLKRRLEKIHKKDANSNNIAATNKHKKRGILDDDEETEQDENSTKDAALSLTMDPEQLKATDEIEYLGAIKASHKIKAFVFVPVTKVKRSTKQQQIVQVACALSTNTIEVYSLERQPQAKKVPGQQPVQSAKVANLTPLLGHATGVRTIALSSSDDLAATISKGTCKIWNVANRTCLQSATLEPMMDPRKPQQASTASFQGL
jgi:U3 small nucleolar RNA-associated protein 12